MAAEKHVRIEFWNLVGGAMTSFTYQGDTVLTCYAGVFRLESSTETVKLGELDHAVVPVGTASARHPATVHSRSTFGRCRAPMLPPSRANRKTVAVIDMVLGS